MTDTLPSEDETGRSVMNPRSKAEDGDFPVSHASKYHVREPGSQVSDFEGDYLADAQRERDKMRDAGKIMATIFELHDGAWKEVSPEDPTEALTRKLQSEIRQMDAPTSQE